MSGASRWLAPTALSGLGPRSMGHCRQAPRSSGRDRRARAFVASRALPSSSCRTRWVFGGEPDHRSASRRKPSRSLNESASALHAVALAPPPSGHSPEASRTTSPTCRTRRSSRLVERWRGAGSLELYERFGRTATASPSGCCAITPWPRTPSRTPCGLEDGVALHPRVREGEHLIRRWCTTAPSTSSAARSAAAPSRSRRRRQASRRGPQQMVAWWLEQQRVQAGAARAPRPAARGDRARVLRRLHAGGARRPAGRTSALSRAGCSPASTAPGAALGFPGERWSRTESTS